MPHTPEQSAIRLTPEIESALASAQFEDIKDILTQAALDQQLVVRDEMNPTILLETTLASAAPKRFAKTIGINGVKHILEADDEAGLLRAENDLMRQTFAEPAATAQQTEQPRDAAGRFTSQTELTPADAALEAARIAELELKFKRGEISTDEYLTHSGAIERHLESLGVDVPSLRDASSAHFQDAWADATTAFKARHPEWDAQFAGEENATRIGQILAENNLVNSDDKLAAMEAAYQHAVENGLLVENPAVVAAKEVQARLAAAQRPEDIRDILISARGGSSGLFGR